MTNNMKMRANKRIFVPPLRGSALPFANPALTRPSPRKKRAAWGPRSRWANFVTRLRRWFIEVLACMLTLKSKARGSSSIVPREDNGFSRAKAQNPVRTLRGPKGPLFHRAENRVPPRLGCKCSATLTAFRAVEDDPDEEIVREVFKAMDFAGGGEEGVAGGELNALACAEK